jgi:transposase
MRFVAIKSQAQQANALVFRARDLLVRQRTQMINASRGHLLEFGWVVPNGRQHLGDLSRLIRKPASDFPEEALPVLEMLLGTLDTLSGQIAALEKNVARRARDDEVARRLITMPGIGPATAVALEALASPSESRPCSSLSRSRTRWPESSGL